MIERLNFLVMYIGSAAMTAFLAACLSSPQVDHYVCHTSLADGSEKCEVVATVPAELTAANVASATSQASAEQLVPEMMSPGQ